MTSEGSQTACLEGEQIARLLQEGPSADELDALLAHAETCARCAEQIALVRRDNTDTVVLDTDTGKIVAGGSGDRNDDFLNQLAYLRSLFDPPTEPPFVASFADYDIEGALGRGGMGIVLRARERSLQRQIALKVLSPDLAADETARARFQREAHSAAAIGDHEGIVSIYAVGEEKGVPYIAMQYVEGGTLQQRLDTTGPLPEEDIRRFGANTARALGYAHQAGLVHRDVKPSNILLDSRRGVAVLADFGLARGIGDSSLTTSGSIVGTAQYMPPEQANADVFDQRSDLYSLGAVLYAMCAGQPPFRAESPLALLRKVCDDAPEDLRRYNRNLSGDLRSLVGVLLAKDPEDRVQSAMAVAEFLERKTKLSVANVVWRDADEDEDTPGTHAAISGRHIGIDIGSRSLRLAELEPEAGADASPEGSSIPAMIVADGGAFYFGESALLNATSPQAEVAHDVAYRMGSEQSMVRLAGEKIPAEALVALMSRAAVGADEQRPLARAGYVVPGCFGDARRRALRNALEIAPIEPATPLSAAAAMAIDFGWQNGWFDPSKTDTGRRLLVVACGTHTFDATVVQVALQQVRVLSAVGDVSLGGDAWTGRLVRRVAEHVKKHHGVDLLADRATRYDLRRRCEATKLKLANAEKADVRIRVNGELIKRSISRRFFTWIAGDLLKRLEEHVQRAMVDAEVDWRELDYVLLSGGAAQMQDFRGVFKKLSRGRVPCLLGQPAAAANGAALYAKGLAEAGRAAPPVAVREMTAFSYAFTEASSDAMLVTRVLSANAPLPASAVFLVPTIEINQSELGFDLLERPGSGGPGEVVARCRLFGLLPGMAIGSTVPVTLSLDAGGLVSLSVDPARVAASVRLQVEYPNALAEHEVAFWGEWLASQSDPA